MNPFAFAEDGNIFRPMRQNEAADGGLEMPDWVIKSPDRPNGLTDAPDE